MSIRYLSFQISLNLLGSHKRVCAAGPGQLLAPLVEPEVADPLGPGQDGAGRVPGHVVSLPVLVEVVPERRRPLLGPERDPEAGEDGGPALLHLRHVHQKGRDSVTWC